jgi:hypothetical protein
MAASASLNSKKEVANLLPGSNSRPADIFVPTWKSGRPTAFNVTVISPLHGDIFSKTAETPGFALGLRKDAKLCQYVDGCHASGLDCIPLVVESLGGWDKEAVSHLKHLAICTARQIGAEQSKTVSHFFQRLSVLLQLGTPPSSRVDTHRHLLHTSPESCDVSIFKLLFYFFIVVPV